eukprot:6631245-Prymnesium_polylepis.1
MLVNDVEISNCFELRKAYKSNEDIKNGTAGEPFMALHPDAYLKFADELAPNLLVGHDMLVCFPAFDQYGRPLMEGAFSMCFRYDSFRESLPILGLIHNDVADPNPMNKVEGDFYIYSNKHLTYTVKGKETNMSSIIELIDSAKFLQTSKKGTPPPPNFKVDHPAWDTACSAFQNERKKEIWAAIERALDKMKLPEFSTNELFVTNLVGRNFPKQASELICPPLAHTVTPED